MDDAVIAEGGASVAAAEAGIEVQADIVDSHFHLVEVDTCCAPGYEAVSLKNLKADQASFVFIADESPLHRKLGVYENRG